MKLLKIHFMNIKLIILIIWMTFWWENQLQHAKNWTKYKQLVWSQSVLVGWPESPDSGHRNRLCAWSCTPAQTGGSAPRPAGSTAGRGHCHWSAAGRGGAVRAAGTERCSTPPSQRHYDLPWRRHCCNWRQCNGPCGWCAKGRSARPEIKKETGCYLCWEGRKSEF